MANEYLRRLREATPSPSGSGLPMTRAELAAAVNQYIWSTTGKHCHLDVDTLARYERGLIRWPSAMYRDGLRAVLGAQTDAGLGFYPTPRGRSTASLSNPQSWAVPRDTDAEDPAASTDMGRAMASLRRVLVSYRPDRVAGSSPDAVKRGVAASFSAYQAGRYEDSALRVVDAMRGLRNNTDLRVRALAHQIAAIVLTKAGHADIAWIAADRGVFAAEAAEDARLHLSLIRTAAFAMAAGGHHADALTSIDAAAHGFQRHMAQTPASASVYGTLLLSGAVLAAGHGNPRLASTYLDEAQRAADVNAIDRNDLWTAFGPTNVAIHRANVAAALGDMDAVLSVGGALSVEHLPVERQVRLHLDVARASLAVGDREDALATLVRAEATAPSQVRHHHITKDVVTSLIATAQRRPGAALTRLATLVGVAP
ncbi:hypothetical protein L1785_18675 [Antribacter sp. KLBMP9083]|uniref:Uncharacterized protein n=1 Tax=Antribacter soli TaxID=2910976 RepID=A0AA41QGF3_9MICO|nr:hypothetical protein [Antribacter soli]MCF4123004.1 hypothetical protein [Antribacter soli]